MNARPAVALTADQVVTAYNSVQTQADMGAAYRLCDAAKKGFGEHDRTRVVRAMVAAVSRLKTWSSPPGHQAHPRLGETAAVASAAGEQYD
jgi:hypothetical protein